MMPTFHLPGFFEDSDGLTAALRVMRRRSVVSSVAAFALGAGPLLAQPDLQFNADFDLADRRAQTLAWTIQCQNQFGILIQRGAIPSIRSKPAPGTTSVCFTVGKRR